MSKHIVFFFLAHFYAMSRQHFSRLIIYIFPGRNTILLEIIQYIFMEPNVLTGYEAEDCFMTSVEVYFYNLFTH